MLNEKDMNQLVDELCRINGTDTSYYLRLDTESKEDIELLNIISVSVHVKMMVNYLLGESNYNISVYDLYKMQYKGRDANALENYRLEGLKRIAEEPDPLKKVSIFYDYARELKNSINILSIMDYITKNTRTLVYLEVCLNRPFVTFSG